MANSDGRNDFYADKNMVRHMIIIRPEFKLQLKQLAKSRGLTQGEVVEVLLENVASIDEQKFVERAACKRTVTKTELFKKMKDLKPEQLQAIEAILNAKGE